MIGLGRNVGLAAASLVALSAAPERIDLDGGPVWVGPGEGSRVIHRRGRFKPNQRKQRRGEKA